MKHYAFTSHTDNTAPKHKAAYHGNQHKPQSLYPTEQSGNPKRPRDHKTMLPHPNEPQPKDDPKGRTKRASDRPMQAQKTIGKKIEHNNNHPNTYRTTTTTTCTPLGNPKMTDTTKSTLIMHYIIIVDGTATLPPQHRRSSLIIDPRKLGKTRP
jgi:hypothetical protein